MTTPQWQLQNSIDAIVFDCDGTLSRIEGVNELARHNGVYPEVEALTTEAMSVSGINPDVYQHRLNLIHPTLSQVEALGEQYFVHIVPDALEVIQSFQRLGKSVYLVSAGINPAVMLFGERLGIAREHIYAVTIQFDPQGHYLDYDRSSMLIHNHGKHDIVTKLKAQHANLVHIGDGLNDYSTHDIVTRFVGYGGVYYREQMKANCRYYIETLSLASLLPLCLTSQEVTRLTPTELALYQSGVNAIASGQVKV